MVVNDYVGRSGGLALFWRNGVNVHVRGISHLYIDVDVMEKGGSCGISWVFMGSQAWRGKQSWKL